MTHARRLRYTKGYTYMTLRLHLDCTAKLRVTLYVDARSTTLASKLSAIASATYTRSTAQHTWLALRLHLGYTWPTPSLH